MEGFFNKRLFSPSSDSFVGNQDFHDARAIFSVVWTSKKWSFSCVKPIRTDSFSGMRVVGGTVARTKWSATGALSVSSPCPRGSAANNATLVF